MNLKQKIREWLDVPSNDAVFDVLLRYTKKEKFDELDSKYATLTATLWSAGTVDIHPLWQAVDKLASGMLQNAIDIHHIEGVLGITDEEPGEVATFNPKDYESRDQFPKELGGYDIGFIELAEDAPLCYRGKGDVMTVYEGEGDNTAARRIIPKAGRVLAVLAPKYSVFKDIDLHYDEPYPFGFDGVGNRGYRIMNEQSVDGRDLWEIGEALYVHVGKVSEAWMP